MKKNKDGYYVVTSKLPSGTRKYFYGKTQKEAISKREKFFKETGACKNYDANLTLSEWAENWLKLKKSSISAKTFESYSWIIKHYIIPAIGIVPIAELSPLHIHTMIDDMKLSPRTITYTLTVLGAMLKTAVQYEYINRNVATLVKKPKKEKLHEMITLTKQQVQEFLSCIPLDETRTLFKVAFTTGLRRSELLGLRWKDIDFKKHTLSVNQTVIMLDGSYIISKTTKNASSRRTISLDDETLNELKKHSFSVRKRMIASTMWIDNDLVFAGKDGKPRDPKAVSRACKKYATKIGVPNFTMHGTRHTHATLLIESGVNFKALQVRLGHASYTETMNTYSHLTPIMEADIVKRIATIF